MSRAPNILKISRGSRSAPVSGSLYVGGLLALGSLGDLETHLLAFLQRLEAVHLNCRKMRKQIFAAVIGRDETVALCIVEPLNRTDCHTSLPLEKNAGRIPADRLSFKSALSAKPVLQYP
jgi:hypothetical protein